MDRNQEKDVVFPLGAEGNLPNDKAAFEYVRTVQRS